MKSELTLALNELAEHFNLPQDVVVDAVENALVNAYRKSANISANQLVEVKIDIRTGQFTVFSEKEVVDSVQDYRTEVTLSEAHKLNPDVQLGDMAIVDSTPDDFGRIAAQTAKQVVLQRLREAERDAQYAEYAEREGDIVLGTVQSATREQVTLGLGRAEAVMHRNQYLPTERFRPHDKVRAYVISVRKTPRGPQIMVSRTHKNMLRRLLENEVPEIYNGLIEIKSIAREPGHRSKVAVSARQEGIDPVGACVGMRGVRIQSIVRELNDEKIDVIEWNPDANTFIAKSLSPARVSGVYLDNDSSNRTATVIVPDDQLSLAIGREGQNARLAAKLTGWRIDIKGVSEAATEALDRVINDPTLVAIKTRIGANLDRIGVALERKRENRPVAPEDYNLMEKLVDAVERDRIDHLDAVRVERRKVRDSVRATIAPMAFQTPVAETPLSDDMRVLLSDSDFETAGDILEALTLDKDRLLRIDGMGPKVLRQLESELKAIEWPEPPAAEPEPEPEVVAVVEPEPVAEPEPVLVDINPADLVSTTAPELEIVAEVTPEVAMAEVGAPQDPYASDLVKDDVDLSGVQFAEEELDDDNQRDDKKGKKGKKKGRTLMFDEESGRYVSVKQRKSGRYRWDTELEE